jgi:hypothetical protein
MKIVKYTLLLLLLSVTYAFSANLRGTVKDADSGEPLIGANVVLAGTSMGTTTDADGFFVITGIQPGEYVVEISYLGYQDARQTITVGNETVTLNVSLKSITISASAINVVSNRARERETPVAFVDLSKEEIQQQLGSRDIPLVLNTTPSIYATQQGGGSGDARVNVRGFDQRNVAVMINGVPVNDMENGWVYWSNWDGIGDATQSIQVQRGLSAVNLAVPSIGGTMNIITDPAGQDFGGMVKQELGEDGFLKTTASFNTGLINNKFALSASAVRKIGDGTIEKTWTDAWAYYFGAAYNINSNNRLEFYALGAPQKHGQNLYRQNIATYSHKLAREVGFDDDAINAFTERGRLYNQNWNVVDPSYTGKQAAGDKTFDRHDPNFLNERENFFHKPQVNLNWYSRLNEKVNLYTVLYYSGGSGGGTGTFGRIPSDGSRLDWNRVIRINRDSTFTTYRNISKEKGQSIGILRNSRNDQWTVGAIVKTEVKGNNSKTTFGIDWRTAEIDHYREVRDLLGGEYYDIRFRGGRSDFWTQESDFLRKLGDRIDYDFTNTVDWVGGFLQHELRSGNMSAYGTFGVSAIQYDHTNHFRAAKTLDNGDPDLSSGELYVKTDWIQGYQLKGGASYRVNNALNVFGNVGIVSKVPIFDDVIDDGTGIVRQDPKNEQFRSVEFGVNFTDPEGFLGINLTGYFTTWKDRAQRRSLRLTQGGEDVVVFLTGIDSRHSGIELDADMNFHRMFKLKSAISIGKWIHTNDVTGDFRVYGENDDPNLPTSTKLNFALDGLRVGDAPQTQYSFSGYFKPIKGFVGILTYRYYANHWAAWSPFDRVFGDAIGVTSGDRTQSWKLPNYGLLDLNINYDVPLNFGSLKPRLFLNVFNLLDELYISDALDNSRFNAYRGNGVNHSADDAEVYVGMPRYINAGVQFNF